MTKEQLSPFVALLHSPLELPESDVEGHDVTGSGPDSHELGLCPGLLLALSGFLQIMGA